jgi:hypothetical protein
MFPVQVIVVLQNVVFLQQATYIVIQDASDVSIRPKTGYQSSVAMQRVGWHSHPNDTVRYKFPKEFLFVPAFALEGHDLIYIDGIKIEIAPQPIVLEISGKGMHTRITPYVGDCLSLELCNIIDIGLSVDLNDLMVNDYPNAADVHCV